jgi:hypothetical protein
MRAIWDNATSMVKSAGWRSHEAENAMLMLDRVRPVSGCRRRLMQRVASEGRKADRGLNSLQFQPARLGYRQRRARPRNPSHDDTATGWQHRSRFRSIPVFAASAWGKCIVHKRRDKSGKLCRPGKNCGRSRGPIYVLFARHAGNAPTFHEDGLGFHAQRLGAPARI